MADSDWGGKIFTGLFVLIALVCTGTAAVRAADIAWKSAWIVAHWPPERDLCISSFCVRTDTVPSEDAPGVMVAFAHCPEHGGTTVRRGREIVIFVGWCILVAIASLVLMALAGAVVAKVAMWPVLVPMCLARKVTALSLIPFGWLKKEDWDPWPEAWHGRVENVGMMVGVVLAIGSWGVFLWW